MSYDEKGMVVCVICGKHYNQITPKHVKSHGFTMAEYKEKYPKAPLVSVGFKAKQKFRNNKTVFSKIDIDEELKKGQKQEIDIEEMEIDKIPKLSKLEESIKTEDNFLSEIKELIDDNQLEYPNPNNSIHRDKIKILNFLIIHFPDVRNSYYVEKISVSGMMEYKLITDIAIPSLKINFEFPKSFWHNSDYPKRIRDAKLKKDGWKIIDINEPKPTVSHIKEIVENFLDSK